MAKMKEIEVYTLEEVLKILGLNNTKNILEEIKNGEFPFPAININGEYMFPKKPINNFFNGYKVASYKPVRRNIFKGRPRKWKREETKYLNFPVSKKLSKQFNKLSRNINKKLPNPLTKSDFLRLAMEEFIEYRAEFQEKAADNK